MTPTTTSSINKSFALNKVPEVTLAFWAIKIMATTVGEAFADFLNMTIGMGLTITTVLMVGAFAVALYFQLKRDRYVPWLYWLTVGLVSVSGTLITDNLTDHFGVPLWLSTSVFTALLAVVFSIWYSREQTLSIHHIDTPNREKFYWLAILTTFALGTAAGDWSSEALGLGFAVSAAIWALAIALIALVHFTIKSPNKSYGVLAFWFAYILTRPLGASLGDLLSVPRDENGLGLTTTGTSAIFLVAMVGMVVYMTKNQNSNHGRE